jgi:DNA-binding transcriptional regulator YiaG
MKAVKRKKLEATGWAVGSAADFLGLSPEEEAYIEAKLALAQQIKAVRKAKKMSQATFAKTIHSSQSRVTKMEAGDPSVSVELMMKSLFSAAVSTKQVAQAIASA